MRFVSQDSRVWCSFATHALCFICGVLLVWLCFAQKADQTVLPVCPSSTRDYDVVVASCRNKATLSLVQGLRDEGLLEKVANLWIYAKCGPVPGLANVVLVGNSMCSACGYSLVTVPNIGREGHTFVTHMLTHRERFVSYTVYLQDEPAAHLFPGWKLSNYFTASNVLPVSAQVMRLGEVLFDRVRDGFEGLDPCQRGLLKDRKFWELRNSHTTFNTVSDGWGNSSAYLPITKCLRSIPWGGAASCNWLPLLFDWIKYSKRMTAVDSLQYTWDALELGPFPEVFFYIMGGQFSLDYVTARAIPVSRLKTLQSLMVSNDAAGFHGELLWVYIVGQDAGWPRPNISSAFLC